MNSENQSKLKIVLVSATENKQMEKENEQEDDEEFDYIKIPPDGGFGWVVVIACFVGVSEVCALFIVS